jgi:DNA polymerase III gamma/tau subunit
LSILREEQQAAVLTGLCANCKDVDNNTALNVMEAEPSKIFLNALPLR